MSAMAVPPAGLALLLVTMEPPATLEEEFNDWYDSEHFPQRCALPGFIGGQRWVAVHGFPRYLALYDLAARSALESAEYRAVSGERATPWSRRLLPHTIGMMRIVADQIDPGDAVAVNAAEVARLVVARYRGGSGEQAATLSLSAARLPGLRQVRVFAEAAADSASWLIAAFDRPHTIDTLSGALGAATGATLFNVYVPYWRR